jgi:peptidoglycan/xylan/chitin deacetylase (PgdA/CDA1 family)
VRQAALLLAAAAPIGAAPAAAPQGQGPAIAVTIDDLSALGPWPDGTDRIEIARKDVAALRAAGAGKVYGFVNHAVAERDPATAPVLQVWRDAGLPLANHGWSHADLHTVGAAAFIEDIDRNEPYLSALMGKNDWHWFRYPYLREGVNPAERATVRQELAKRGYKIAAVTMSFEDYLWNPPYARCVAAGNQAAIGELERSYLAAATDAARASRSQAQAIYGRDIPYVLLIHIGTFTSRMLPRLLAQYRQQGFRFVTLPQAESDPAYASDVDPSLPAEDSLSSRTANLSTVFRAPDYGRALAAMCQPATASPTR